jgi:hypothetical protein
VSATRTTRVAIAGIALIVFTAYSLDAQTSANAEDGPPRIKIYFPSSISMENVWLEYTMFSPSGASIYVGLSDSRHLFASRFDPGGNEGHIVEPKSYPDHYYEVAALQDGYPAKRFKALAWSKGCQVVTFDVAVDTTDLALPFTCTPLRNVILTGRVKGIDSDSLPGTITATYNFDAIAQSETVATGEVHADGSFKIDLPDFSVDPTLSGHLGEFQLDLNHSIVLEPELEEWQMHGLRVASGYPNSLVLVRSTPPVRHPSN